MRMILLAACATTGLLAQEFSAPKPTAHHLAMKRQVGTWDAVVKAQGAPGQPPMVSKGVEVNTLVPGGLWLTSEFKSDFMGMPFEGRGIFGFDPALGKHVGTWIDSTVMALAHPMGTCKDDCRETTLTFDGPDMTGKTVTYKNVTVEKSPDLRVMTMYVKGQDGTFKPSMEIEYTRRK